MNHKQKLGYILLGAGIMALGIIIGQWVTPDIEAQADGVFDEIRCSKLTVVDKVGNRAIVLDSHKGGNGITVYEASNRAIVLFSNNSASSVSVLDKAGNRVVYLDNHKGGSGITVSDEAGNPAMSLISTNSSAPSGGDNFITIHDRAGNIRWEAP